MNGRDEMKMNAMEAKEGGEADETKKKGKCKFKVPESDSVIQNISGKKFTAQSKRKMKWATNMYCQWRLMRLCDKNVDVEIVRADLFKVDMLLKSELAYAMCRFVREIKKLDGSDYPPNTICEIVIMIQMHLHEHNMYWMLDGEEFLNLRNVVNNTMRERTAAGLGVKKLSEVISLRQKDVLFSSGQLGEGSPQQLLNTVIYMVGLHCVLRGGVEHQHLRRLGFNSQITFEEDERGIERLVYREDPLQKTMSGRYWG